MRLSSTALLSRLYDRNEATGAYIIKVAVDHYADFFNEWDPAPFRRRIRMYKRLEEAPIRFRYME